MSTWKVAPVKQSDGSDWLGIAYISDGKRQYGALNDQQAAAICDAHNEATAKLELELQRANAKCAEQAAATAKLREALEQREEIIKSIEWSTGDKFPRH
jgi:vacuolar-type H+-ATPase subunit E/Vma4